MRCAIALLLLLFLAGCSKNSPTAPEPPAEDRIGLEGTYCRTEVRSDHVQVGWAWESTPGDVEQGDGRFRIDARILADPDRVYPWYVKTLVEGEFGLYRVSRDHLQFRRDGGRGYNRAEDGLVELGPTFYRDVDYFAWGYLFQLGPHKYHRCSGEELAAIRGDT